MIAQMDQSWLQMLEGKRGCSEQEILKEAKTGPRAARKNWGRDTGLLA